MSKPKKKPVTKRKGGRKKGRRVTCPNCGCRFTTPQTSADQPGGGGQGGGGGGD
jgi:transcriptional regulator NrdR family protein